MAEEERGAPRISERWIPLFAAVVGLAGGAIGAYVGGSVANEGQQHRFENEQTAETRNLRVDAYAALLAACESAYQTGRSVESDLRAAQARARLITSSTEVREAARALGPDSGACGTGEREALDSAEESFIEAAQPEVTGD